MTEPFEHEPVMVEQIAKVFESVADGVLLDATLGGGGHAERLLRLHDGLRVLGLDRDESALRAARHRLIGFGDRLMVYHCRFDRLDRSHGSTFGRQLGGGVVRPRGQLTTARSRPARVLLSSRSTARHAHGPARSRGARQTW